MDSINTIISSDILNDLSSRFIINIPEEERKDLIRICFQIELAYWFYLDFYCSNNSELKKCNMKEFTYNIFNHIPFLKVHMKNLQSTLELWREYKQSVPTFGAIILNEELTHVLLVQGFYAKSSWGFPKGKVNEEEEPWKCAIREVQEETGYDISPLINQNDYLESTINDQVVRLYIVAGVPHNTQFIPCTRCEIRAVEWFPISDLPSSRKDMTPKLKIGLTPNNFYMVVPFMKRVRQWIFKKMQAVAPQLSRRARIKSLGDNEAIYKSNVKKQLFAFGIQAEVAEYQQIKANQTAQGRPIRKAENGNGRNKNGAAKCVEEKDSKQKQAVLQYDKMGNVVISAPSWVNFHFDRAALMQELIG